MQHAGSPPLRQAALRPRGQGTGPRATSGNWNELAAAGVVLVVPALLATIVVQRGFVRGLTFGAVKQ